MKTLGPTYQILYSELRNVRCDAQFSSDFPEPGTGAQDRDPAWRDPARYE